MLHYRDAKAGKFHLNHEDWLPPSPDPDPPFLRFARKQGVGVNLWTGEGREAVDLLRDAGLNWPVHRREVLVPARRPQDDELSLFTSERAGLAEAREYRALVRPDTEEIMSVVTTAYGVAENRWVALAAERFASRLKVEQPLFGAVSFGRNKERTLFLARLRGDEEEALCLLAYNSHGGEGAVKFQIVEANRQTGTVYVLDTRHATYSVPHVGDMEERLLGASDSKHDETFIERYVAETEPLWRRLQDTNWSPRRTKALIQDLWGDNSALHRGPTHWATRSVEYGIPTPRPPSPRTTARHGRCRERLPRRVRLDRQPLRGMRTRRLHQRPRRTPRARSRQQVQARRLAMDPQQHLMPSAPGPTCPTEPILGAGHGLGDPGRGSPDRRGVRVFADDGGVGQRG